MGVPVEPFREGPTELEGPPATSEREGSVQIEKAKMTEKVEVVLKKTEEVSAEEAAPKSKKRKSRRRKKKPTSVEDRKSASVEVQKPASVEDHKPVSVQDQTSASAHDQWPETRPTRYRSPIRCNGGNRCNGLVYPRLSLARLPGQRYLVPPRVRIPALPIGYAVNDPRVVCDFEVPEERDERTQEEKNRDYENALARTRLFKSIPMIIPDWRPFRVKFLEVTAKGTMKIRLTDKRNVMVYESMKKRCRFFSFIQNTQGFDAKIREEDVQRGRIVLAYLEDQDFWFRGRITSFNKSIIMVQGVDECLSARLPYDKVFYLHGDLHYDCPFQMQECYLSGLDKWQDGSYIRFIWCRLETELLKLIKKQGRSICAIADNVAGNDDDENQWIDYFNDCFEVTDIEVKDEKYFININFPRSFKRNVSVNEWFLSQLENLNPLKEIPKTP